LYQFRIMPKGKKKNGGRKGGTTAGRSLGPLTAPLRLRSMPMSVVGGFPDKAIVRLAWAASADLTFTATTAQRLEQSLNSAFDPGQALTGAQPANFDIFAVMYNFYRVRGVTVQYRLSIGSYSYLNATVGTAIDQTHMVRCALCPSATLTTLGASNVWTNPRSQLWQVTDAKPVIYNKTWRTSTLLGYSEAQLEGSDRCSALVNADPSMGLFAEFVATPTVVPTGATIVLNVVMNFTYEVEFFDRQAVDTDLSTRLAKNRGVYEAVKAKRVTGTSLPAHGYPASVQLGESKETVESKETKVDFAESLDSVTCDADELEVLRKYKKLFLASKGVDSIAAQGAGAGAGAGGKPSGLGLLSRW
jgi:hypothetical protein